MASAKKLFGTFVLIALLVISVTAVAVESKILKKVDKSTNSGSSDTSDKSSNTKISGTKKVIKKDSKKETPQPAPIQSGTANSNVVKKSPLVGILPITAALIFTDPNPKSKGIFLPRPPDRADTANVDSAASAAFRRIFLKSRTIVPIKKIYPDVESAINSDKHILIQLKNIPTTAEKEQLKNEGINLLYHIPENAWVASISVPISDLKQRSDINFIDRLFPSDRIEPSLAKNGVAEYSKNSDGTANLTVLFFEDVSQSDARAVIEKHGSVLSEPAYKGRNVWLVKIKESKIQNLLSDDSVAYVENSRPPPKPFMDYARNLTGVHEVQDLPYNFLNGSGVIIAQWDGGLPQHIDFNTDGGAPSRLVPGIDNTIIPEDHATRVAGIMIGDGYNSINKLGAYQTQWRGVAPRATLRYYDADFDSNTWYDEIRDATSNGAVVSQHSYEGADGCLNYGTYSIFSSSYYDSLINGEVDLSGKKISSVFAAGNEGTVGMPCNTGIPNYDGTRYGTLPGRAGQTAKNTIAVGMVRSNDGSLLLGSSRGPTDDGRLKPDLVAPGASLAPNFGIKTTTITTADDYNVGVGTSFAAPHVSGIIALMIQDWRNNHGNPDPVPSTVKAILLHTAKDIDNIGPDYNTGFGIVNASIAIDKIREDTSTNDVILDNITIQTDGYTDGANRTYKMSVSGSGHLNITLVWDDVAGAPYAAKELVNDLDLIVLEPDGTTQHYPWTLSNSSPASPAVQTQPNTIDNVEQVVVNSPAAGEWTVIIKGTSVPFAPEQFSLVTSHPITKEVDFVPPVAPQLQKAILTPPPTFGNVEITWQASSDEGQPGGTTQYKIYRATNNYNGPYDIQGTVSAGTYTFTDNPAGNGDPNTYYYVVMAVDAEGNKNWNGVAGKFAKSLPYEKEFVSAPFIQYSELVPTVLQTTNFAQARYYNASDTTDPWKAYITAKPSPGDFRQINHSMGFWIGDSSLIGNYFTVAGIIPQQTQIQLYNGWTMVGFPSVENKLVSDVLLGISYTSIEEFDQNAGPYYLKIKSSTSTMSMGNAYWIWKKDLPAQTITLTNPMPTGAVFNG